MTAHSTGPKHFDRAPSLMPTRLLGEFQNDMVQAWEESSRDIPLRKREREMLLSSISPLLEGHELNRSLTRQDWDRLSLFVHAAVEETRAELFLAQYREVYARISGVEPENIDVNHPDVAPVWRDYVKRKAAVWRAEVDQVEAALVERDEDDRNTFT